MPSFNSASRRGLVRRLRHKRPSNLHPRTTQIRWPSKLSAIPKRNSGVSSKVSHGDGINKIFEGKAIIAQQAATLPWHPTPPPPLPLPGRSGALLCHAWCQWVAPEQSCWSLALAEAVPFMADQGDFRGIGWTTGTANSGRLRRLAAPCGSYPRLNPDHHQACVRRRLNGSNQPVREVQCRFPSHAPRMAQAVRGFFCPDFTITSYNTRNAKRVPRVSR